MGYITLLEAVSPQALKPEVWGIYIMVIMELLYCADARKINFKYVIEIVHMYYT